MSKNYIKDQKGFTLVELLVVIAIIGLLSTIVIISFGAVRTNAANTTIKANLSQIRLMAEMQYNDTGAYTNTNTRGDYNTAQDAINAAGGSENLTQKFDAEDYCCSSVLKGGGNWCVDSTGYVGAKGCNTGSKNCDIE